MLASSSLPSSSSQIAAADSSCSSSSTNPFLLKKRLHFFNNFLDHDGDGFVSWKDLECLLEEVEAIARKEEFIRTKMALIGVWHTLHDAIHREEMSAGEWLSLWEEEADWQQELASHIFDLFDPSGDLFMDESEYVHVLNLFRRKREEALASFDRIGRLPTGEFVFAVDRKRFGQLWTEFFESEDKDSDGSFLFGYLE